MMLFLISAAIVALAQAFVSITYRKYLKIDSKRRITGAEVARKILKKAGLNEVYVVETDGFLTDHYDPTRKVVRLSKNNYEGTSISSIAVSAHECGHAMQDKDNYVFMRIRHKLVPITNFASKIGYVVLLIGFIAGMFDLIWIGIGLELVVLLFQIVTLPVEINASKRALQKIKEDHYLDESEYSQGRNVLIAAALTYVASVASNILEILRLVLIAQNRD